jgi:hypothetical protein
MPCHGGVNLADRGSPLPFLPFMPFSPDTESEKETLAGGAGEVTSEVLMQHPLGRLTC